jgi:hypothetical protein
LHTEYRGGNGPSIAYARQGLIKIYGAAVVGATLEDVSKFLSSPGCPRRVMRTFLDLRQAFGYDPSLQI